MGGEANLDWRKPDSRALYLVRAISLDRGADRIRSISQPCFFGLALPFSTIVLHPFTNIHFSNFFSFIFSNDCVSSLTTADTRNAGLLMRLIYIGRFGLAQWVGRLIFQIQSPVLTIVAPLHKRVLILHSCRSLSVQHSTSLALYTMVLLPHFHAVV